MIRTNGKGTIKISKTLSEELYDLEQNFNIVSIKFNQRKDGLFSLSGSVFKPIIAGLSTLIPPNKPRLIAIKQRISSNYSEVADLHSVSDVSSAVEALSNGPLLSTTPRSYF